MCIRDSFAQAPPAKRRSSKESWEWSDYYGGSGGPAGAGPGACECDEHGYPKRRPRAVDVFSQGSTTRGGISTCPDYEGDEAARSKAARSFLRGLEVSTMTVMWVVSKPPLYVSAVAKGSAAADCGLEVGDVIAGIGSSMRLPHTADEFAEILLKLAERPRPDLVVHVYRDATAGELAAPPCPYPQVVPAGLVLDCAVDSPSAVVDALKAHALEREPVLVTLLEPVLSSALDILYHSIQKRANFDPTAIKGTDVAAAVRNVPALFAVNDFSDLDRGIPKLAALTSTVYDAYKGGAKSLVRYNSPLRLALRGTRVALVFDATSPVMKSMKFRWQDVRARSRCACDEWLGTLLVLEDEHEEIHYDWCRSHTEQKQPHDAVGSYLYNVVADALCDRASKAASSPSASR